MTDQNRILCFGLGFSARSLAGELLAEGWKVLGTTRSAEKAQALSAQGIKMHLFDRGQPLRPEVFAGVTHMLISAPPDARGDPVIDEHGNDIAALPGLRWLGYLSTTGVYGDHQGGWVDEETPLHPGLDRSKRRVAAEQDWLKLWRDHGTPVHIFRLAGIYGPGRSAIESLRAGRAQRVIKPGHVFSRIHVEDIAQILRASMRQLHPGAIYNLCDDEAAPPQDVIAYAAELLGIEPPPEVPFEQAEMSPMARSFYADSKRVRNDKVKAELGIRLKYPTYREGLRAIVD